MVLSRLVDGTVEAHGCRLVLGNGHSFDGHCSPSTASAHDGVPDRGCSRPGTARPIYAVVQTQSSGIPAGEMSKTSLSLIQTIRFSLPTTRHCS